MHIIIPKDELELETNFIFPLTIKQLIPYSYFKSEVWDILMVKTVQWGWVYE